MLEKLLSLFCGIGLVALLVIAGFGTANTKKQEVKAATENNYCNNRKQKQKCRKRYNGKHEGVNKRKIGSYNCRKIGN